MYLRKIIEKPVPLSNEEFEELCEGKGLTAFQSVSLRRAFKDSSDTRVRILKMNQKYKPMSINDRKEQFERYKRTGKLY